MKAAGIYARLSKDRDGKSDSVPLQVEKCRAEAKKRGFTVAPEHIFTDANASASRRKTKRPGFERLMAAIQAGEFSTVFVRETSRLYRRPMELEQVIELLEGKGLHIVPLFSSEQRLDAALERNDILTARIMVAVDAEEAAKISKRSKGEHVAKAQKGEWSGGARPFGYSIVGGRKVDGELARLVINRQAAKALQEAARLLLSGMSLNAMTAEWNDRGMRTPAGGRWAPSHIRRSLLAPTIAGVRLVDGKEVPGTWPAILSADVRKLLVALLTDPARKVPSRVAVNPRKFFLTGLLRCWNCETALVGHTRGAHRYYVCPYRNGGCGKVRVKAAPVEHEAYGAALFSYVNDQRPDPGKVSAEPTNDERKMLADLDAVEVQQQELAESFIELGMTAAQFKAANAKLTERAEALRGKLTDVLTRREAKPEPTRDLFDGVEAYMARFEAGDLTEVEVMREHEFVSRYIDHVTVLRGERGTFTPKRLTIKMRAA